MSRALAALVPGLFALCALAGCDDGELPEVLVVRDFTLTDHEGEPFDSSSLRGKVWVASFVFTSCRDVCPLITGQVANLHRRVSDERVRFVSISVDPEVDTPEVLRAYRARYRADPRWTFLTGDREVVRRVAVDTFHVAMGERRAPDDDDIPHSEELLLVDAEGVLRGSYPTDRDGLTRLEADIGRLLRAD